MRIPGSVAGTINAYLAMRAVLLASQREYAIRRVAMTGLCTGVGAMPYAEAAEQMRTAYDSVIGGGWRRVTQPALAPYALGARRG